MTKIPSQSQVHAWATIAVRDHPNDLSHAFSDHFKVTRQSAVSALKRLVSDEWLERSGRSTRPTYRPGPNRLVSIHETLPNTQEDRLWLDRIAPYLTLEKNVQELAMYCFTEIFNNASDHSSGQDAFISVRQTKLYLSIQIFDNGVGIFEHIASKLHLPHRRLAILELSKGKLTTDPARHSGEGIFFSSRMCDSFKIAANNLEFKHDANEPLDWLQDDDEPSSINGTRVMMHILTNTDRTPMRVFKDYSSDEGRLGFDKTVVPVRLAKVGAANLVSRSQAKRLSVGFDKFRIVVLDFAEVDEIGQAFADELFRVFANANPTIQLLAVNVTPAVDMMRKRVLEAVR